MKNNLRISIGVLIAVGTAIAQDHPKFETYVGYNFTRFNSATNVPAFSANGGNGQFAINANRWLGFVADLGAVHNGNIGDYHIDSTVSNYLFGPRVSMRKSSRLTPFIQTLFGGAHAGNSLALSATPLPGQPIVLPGQPSVPANTPVTLRSTASQTAFAMTAGGGLDIKLSKHVRFRPVQLEYFLTRFQNYRSANDNNQNNLRYSGGLNFTFGGEAPTPPPAPKPIAMKQCPDGSSVAEGKDCPNRNISLGLSVPKTDLCPGDTVSIRPAAQMPENAKYQWTVQGQPTAQAAALDFGTTGRDPGAYRVGMTVSAPGYNDASANTTINVLPYRPPNGTLDVSPAEIWVGDQATLTANVRPGQCGGALRMPQFTASEGTVNGNRFDSSTVQFAPADNSEQRKTVKVALRVADDKGSFTAESSVVVKKRASVVAQRLPDVIFPAGSARVNNCGKRVLLEELKSQLDKDPNGKVVLVGHVNEKEANASKLDQRRALNAAAVLSAGQGVCSHFPAGQVQVSSAGSADNGVDYQSYFCGTSATPKTAERSGQSVKDTDNAAKTRRVEVWFVPSGGSLPASVKDAQDAATLGVASLGCPK
jgi:outer membrane protein OmpA-like peptidoglycan-associated protein